MPYYGAAPTPPRTGELWAAMKARLDTARMQSILGGAGRIRLLTESMAPLGTESETWGRVVIVPVRRMFGEPAEGAGRNRNLAFQIRTDIHGPGGSYDPAIAAEAAQNEAFDRLHGWNPGAFTYGRVVGPISRETAPQSLPLWDDDLGVWFLSAEYRAILAPV